MSNKPNHDQAAAAIEGLRKRFEALHTRRIQLQTQLDSEQQRLQDLKQSALTQFGTDDVERLTAMLEEMERSNQEQVRAYQQSLERIEQALRQVETESISANGAAERTPSS